MSLDEGKAQVGLQQVRVFQWFPTPLIRECVFPLQSSLTGPPYGPYVRHGKWRLFPELAFSSKMEAEFVSWPPWIFERDCVGLAVSRSSPHGSASRV